MEKLNRGTIKSAALKAASGKRFDYWGAMVLLGTISLILAPFTMFLSIGVAMLGSAAFALNLVRTGNSSFNPVSTSLKYFGNACIAYFQICVRVGLWSLLFVIPGIIAGYRYSQTFYILYDNPELGASQAIELSKKIMKGRKWELFVLQLSFLGWYILSFITFGLLEIWVVPYYSLAMAEFYCETRASYEGRGTVNETAGGESNANKAAFDKLLKEGLFFGDRKNCYIAGGAFFVLNLILMLSAMLCSGAGNVKYILCLLMYGFIFTAVVLKGSAAGLMAAVPAFIHSVANRITYYDSYYYSYVTTWHPDFSMVLALVIVIFAVSIAVCYIREKNVSLKDFILNPIAAMGGMLCLSFIHGALFKAGVVSFFTSLFNGGFFYYFEQYIGEAMINILFMIVCGGAAFALTYFKNSIPFVCDKTDSTENSENISQ